MAADRQDLVGVRRFRAPLLRWYRRARRDLPWRRTRDPYAIWVSEVMLQQTTVAAVIPYWARFLNRFPDVAALARAGEEEVLSLWSGLGYYRRARALREGAIAVMERHGGRVPEEPEALQALPGIGRYTAGAIASLAFSREEPVVDGNVKRVFARLFAFEKHSGTAGDRVYWELARELVRGEAPGDLNQAVMELGATICTPRSPDCAVCPLRGACRAYAMGTPEAFPVSRARKASLKVAAAVGWIERRGRVLLERRHVLGLLRGTWDLPAAPVAPSDTPGRAISRAFGARHGLEVRAGGVVARVAHAILDRRLAIVVVSASIEGPVKRSALRWVAPSAIGEVATSGATTKIVRFVLAQKRSQPSRPSRSSSNASSSASSGSSGRAKA